MIMEIFEPKIGKNKAVKEKKTKSEINYRSNKWGNNNQSGESLKNPIGVKNESNPYSDDYGLRPLLSSDCRDMRRQTL